MAQPSSSAPGRPFVGAPMVGWYDPGQLAQTGVEVAISTIFGRYADHRILEGLAREQAVHDYRKGDDDTPRGSIWIDYVGDLGDGWDATYAVARELAKPTLKVASASGGAAETARGRLLVLGGDQVYPTASRTAYATRLIRPYEVALRNTEPPHLDVYAIPGNHDWYDGLVAFTRLFCTSRWMGGWRTRQTCSYFALRLPHGWWMLGTDVQLASDIDEAQKRFFQDVARQMEPDDRIILCNAEPHWVFGSVYANDPDCNEHNLGYLEDRVLDRKISVYVAGDLHHYRRHEEEAPADPTAPVQKITCGGGGAFLHPTHAPDVDRLPERDGQGKVRRTFGLRASYPPPAESRRLAWRNLLFPYLNPWFGTVPAILYLLTAWTLVPAVDRKAFEGWAPPDVFAATLDAVVKTPAAVFWIAAVLGGFLLFTDTHSRVYRIVGGLSHGLAHLTAIYAIGWAATWLTVEALGLTFGRPLQLGLAGAVILVAGYAASGFIMGLYLLISVNGFGRHANEAFSSLRVADWKSFLRLHIDDRGGLTIYPIGLRRVPRRWRASGEGPTLRVEAADARATAPELIEPPITIPPRRAAAGR